MKSLIAVACGAVSLSVGAFELGQADATVWADKANEPVAKELSTYLERVFGKAFAVEDAPKTITDQKGIFVGIVPADYKPAWDERRDCSVRIVEKDRVWLFGNDSRKNVRGTANAVYDFLERYAGVRWLWPGELGTVAEPKEPVSLEDEVTAYVPPFQRRLTDSFGGGRTAQERTDLRAWLAHRHVGQSLPGRGSGCGHAFGSLMPREKYGREHPEYYALVKPEHWIGEPKPAVPTRISDPMMTGPWQLCTSNPEVRRLIARKIIDRKTEDLQSVSPNDGWGFCECDACCAQDAEGQGIHGRSFKLTDRMYDFLADVANQVYRESPTSRIGMFSYSFFSDVPVKKVKLPPNVYLSCCYLVYDMNRRRQDELEAKLSALSEMGAQIIGREYWGTHYTMRYPLSHSRKIDRNLKFLKRVGAAGVYGEPGCNFGARASDLYVLTRLAWNPDETREEILRDFCDKAFGPKAAPVMYGLFESVEDCVERKVEERENLPASKAFAHYKSGYAEFNRFMTTIFDEAFSKMCETAIRKAAALADTPARKDRVAYIGAGLRFAKLTTESLLALEDLAACGNDVPLTMPSDNEIVMEKSALMKVANRALKAENARRMYPVSLDGMSNVLSPDTRSDALSLRPWRTMAERALLKLRSDRYNYLVNGAFEYSGYSWEIAGSGTNVFTTARNHDSDYNVMVQCHGNQGVSLELDVAPHGTMTVKNLRKVSPAEPQKAVLKMFVRSERAPLDVLKVTFGGQELQGVDVTEKIPEPDGWHELRFLPVCVPAGDHEFAIAVTNPGKEPLTVNFDDLDLRLGKPEGR